MRGVAEVNTWGGEERRVEVRVDPIELRRRGFALHDVAEALRRSHGSEGGGRLVRSGEATLVQGVALLTTLADVAWWIQEQQLVRGHGSSYEVPSIYVTGTNGILIPPKGYLQGALQALLAKHNLHFACLMVTDITRHHSVLLVAGDQRVIDAIDYPQAKEHVYDMAGVVSRKKQLFPYMSHVVTKLAAP